MPRSADDADAPDVERLEAYLTVALSPDAVPWLRRWCVHAHVPADAWASHPRADALVDIAILAAYDEALQLKRSTRAAALEIAGTFGLGFDRVYDFLRRRARRRTPTIVDAASTPDAGAGVTLRRMEAEANPFADDLAAAREDARVATGAYILAHDALADVSDESEPLEVVNAALRAFDATRRELFLTATTESKLAFCARLWDEAQAAGIAAGPDKYDVWIRFIREPDGPVATYAKRVLDALVEAEPELLARLNRAREERQNGPR